MSLAHPPSPVPSPKVLPSLSLLTPITGIPLFTDSQGHQVAPASSSSITRQVASALGVDIGTVRLFKLVEVDAASSWPSIGKLACELASTRSALSLEAIEELAHENVMLRENIERLQRSLADFSDAYDQQQQVLQSLASDPHWSAREHSLCSEPNSLQATPRLPFQPIQHLVAPHDRDRHAVPAFPTSPSHSHSSRLADIEALVQQLDIIRQAHMETDQELSTVRLKLKETEQSKNELQQQLMRVRNELDTAKGELALYRLKAERKHARKQHRLSQSVSVCGSPPSAEAPSASSHGSPEQSKPSPAASPPHSRQLSYSQSLPAHPAPLYRSLSSLVAGVISGDYKIVLVLECAPSANLRVLFKLLGTRNPAAARLPLPTDREAATPSPAPEVQRVQTDPVLIPFASMLPALGDPSDPRASTASVTEAHGQALHRYSFVFHAQEMHAAEEVWLWRETGEPFLPSPIRTITLYHRPPSMEGPAQSSAGKRAKDRPDTELRLKWRFECPTTPLTGLPHRALEAVSSLNNNSPNPLVLRVPLSSASVW